jgi:hypothetical protein
VVGINKRGKGVGVNGGGRTGMAHRIKGGYCMIKVFAGLLYLHAILFWILGGLIHLWTVYIAFSLTGLFGGVVSFFFPVISEIYLGYQAWSLDGFNTLYIQCLIGIFVLWLLRYVLLFFMTLAEKGGETNE